MKQGSLSEHSLTAAVLKDLRKSEKSVKVGAAVGNDYANVNGIITAEGVGEKPFIAWYKGMNNFLCSGGSLSGVRITMLLPTDTKESAIKRYMTEFHELAAEAKVVIVGGHTQILDEIRSPEFVVSLFGTEGDYTPDKKSIKAGFDIVMVGYAGLLGADCLLEQHRETYEKCLSESFLDSAKSKRSDFCVREAVDKLKEESLYLQSHICYMHDISCGGVYAALWQLGKWMNKGFVIQNAKIGIRQETVELCEVFDLNPYLCDGTGGLLIVCENGSLLCRKLSESNLQAAVIGKVMDSDDSRERIVVFGEDDRRTLAPPDGDERYAAKDRV